MSPEQLRPGLVVEVASAAGINIARPDRKCAVLCPFHEDRRASAFVDPITNVFYCSVCGSYSAKRFSEALGVPWTPREGGVGQGRHVAARQSKPATSDFLPADAARVWHLALSRARDDHRIEDDRQVYDYVASRGLQESWEHRLYGVLSAGMDLPEAIAWYPSAGYRLLAVLYDRRGEIANVQARAIRESEPKTRFPKDSKVTGTVFASKAGLEVLRGTWRGPKRLILGEGLTDYLALATVAPVPVLAAPGTSFAARTVGPWIKDFESFIALDYDKAGHAAVQPTGDAAYRHGARAVRRVEWPRGCIDACDLVKQIGLAGLSSFLREKVGGAS